MQHERNKLIVKLYFLRSFIALSPELRQQRVTLTLKTVNVLTLLIYVKKVSDNVNPPKKPAVRLISLLQHSYIATLSTYLSLGCAVERHPLLIQGKEHFPLTFDIGEERG